MCRLLLNSAKEGELFMEAKHAMHLLPKQFQKNSKALSELHWHVETDRAIHITEQGVLIISVRTTDANSQYPRDICFIELKLYD